MEKWNVNKTGWTHKRSGGFQVLKLIWNSKSSENTIFSYLYSFDFILIFVYFINSNSNYRPHICFISSNIHLSMLYIRFILKVLSINLWLCFWVRGLLNIELGAVWLLSIEWLLYHANIFSLLSRLNSKSSNYGWWGIFWIGSDADAVQSFEWMSCTLMKLLVRVVELSQINIKEVIFRWSDVAWSFRALCESNYTILLGFFDQDGY